MKNEIQQMLAKIIKDLTGEDIAVALEIPTDMSHGDYTTNVAFQVAKVLKTNPREAAEQIRLKINDLRLKNLEKVEVAGPGFVNFSLSQDYFFKKLQEMVDQPSKIGTTEVLKNKKISVEFTDPNPFKEFHIGHVYTNTVGESISRLFEANGATVWRADYFGDVGMHVAKAIFGLRQKIKDLGYTIKELEHKTPAERAKFLGECYAFGATVYEEDAKAAEEMKRLNKIIFIVAQKMWEKENGLKPQIDYQKGEHIDEKEFAEIYELYTKGRQWSLEYFDSIYARLGMKFDGYYPESLVGEKGYQLVKEHIADGIFQEDQGAIVFSKEKNNLHTRVFINSLGLPTYEAKELGLAPTKYEDFKYDESYIITGNEIIEYFKVLVAAITMINPELGKKTHHIGHGMVRLPEGKMSSRTGKVITGEWVLNEAVKRAEELSKEKNQEIAEQVGIAAVKYAFLKSGIGKDIEFDFETSLSLNGNSGPYLQYTYVRTQSILNKVKNISDRTQIELSKSDSSEISDSLKHRVSSEYHLDNDEFILLRLLTQFDSVIEEAGYSLAPSTLCTYLYELAKQFNLFYQTHRILNTDRNSVISSETRDLSQTEISPEQSSVRNDNLKQFRLALTSAVGLVLARGLDLLGIAAPKKM